MKISDYFKNDYTQELFPVDRRMDVIREKNVEGMSTENIRFIINEICRLYCKDLYVEVGSWKGCSLISASLNNTIPKFIGIDNFSQFEGNINILKENLKDFNVHNAEIIEGDYENIIKSILKEKSIDVYFYDGYHSYEHQKNGLNIIKPYLKDDCIILVDDIVWPEPKTATLDWLAENTDFEHITLKENESQTECSKYWWLGLMILSRNIKIEI